MCNSKLLTSEWQANNKTVQIQTVVELTQQCRSSRILSFDTSRSREALGGVTAAVVKAQLFTGRLRGSQFLWDLLLSSTFLTPQLMTVLPQWKTGEMETVNMVKKNIKNVVIQVINRRIHMFMQQEAKHTLVGASCPGPRPWGTRCLTLAQLYSVCWGPSLTCGQTGPGQTEGCWTTREAKDFSIMHC